MKLNNSCFQFSAATVFTERGRHKRLALDPLFFLRDVAKSYERTYTYKLLEIYLRFLFPFVCKCYYNMDFNSKTYRIESINYVYININKKSGVCLRPHGRNEDFIIFN